MYVFAHENSSRMRDDDATQNTTVAYGYVHILCSGRCFFDFFVVYNVSFSTCFFYPFWYFLIRGEKNTENRFGKGWICLRLFDFDRCEIRAWSVRFPESVFKYSLTWLALRSNYSIRNGQLTFSQTNKCRERRIFIGFILNKIVKRKIAYETQKTQRSIDFWSKRASGSRFSLWIYANSCFLLALSLSVSPVLTIHSNYFSIHRAPYSTSS